MKDYLQIAKNKGLYAAITELEVDIISEFAGEKRVTVARLLRLNRTTLIGKLVKLNLGHLFIRVPKSKKRKEHLDG
jgi:hypothetical protein